MNNDNEAIDISIPTGAIKRDSIQILLVQIPLFQFLLVRLKEIVPDFEFSTETEFQFLLVRLKGSRYPCTCR